ncbi:MAG: M48 family metallopeptidase [Candidatus Margulisiibacteriota bacterium]
MLHQIIRSRRRSIALEITPQATLVVRAPHRAPHAMIAEMIARHKGWIERQIERVTRYSLRVTHVPLTPAERESFLHIVRERVELFSARGGYRPQRVRLSRAAKRWGSCSRQGSLNFSDRLARAPLSVLDYVVAHELAHLVQPNHSRRFWAEVERLLPGYNTERVWLKERGRSL